MSQKLAVRLLEKHRHGVVVAANGLEALAAIEKEAFDLVLTDIQMPEMDGVEVTRAIREKEQLTGMDSYVSKPINSTELIAALDLVITRNPLPDLSAS